MPTLKNVERPQIDFDYPEGLPERLAWFTRETGVGAYHILRLMGRPHTEARTLAAKGVDWSAVVTETEDAAWWVEGMLYDALSLFNFDTAGMQRRLSQLTGPEFLVPLPGGSSVPVRDLPPETREDTLLALLAQGGPAALPPLVAYLSQPVDALASS